MLINEDTRYLFIPTSRGVAQKKLRFYEGEKLLLDLDAELSEKDPEFILPYDMSGFFGRDIEVIAENGVPLSFGKSKAAICEIPLRPKVHFTAEYGLINDPNGLIYYEGKYHVFFQHNPAGNIMANMHWGHAVSDDLLTFTQLPTAITPDDMGDMWSGSAIIDEKNLLGFNTPEHKALVIFYTASGNRREVSKDKPFTQCIAVSTDGGYTFKKYDKNPVVPFIEGSNRDPKVIYDKQSDTYAMVLYIDGSKYALLRSANLTDWELIHTFEPGYTIECPDLFFLYENGVKKWVFAGGNSTFLVCDFDINRGIYNVTNRGRYAFGRIYAGQSFFNVEDRILRLDVQKTRELPTEYFNSYLTPPYEVYLKDNILRLKPARELFAAATPFLKISKDMLDGACFQLPSYSVTAKLSLSDIGDETTITIFETDFTINSNTKQITFSDVTMPCHIENGKVELFIIIDKIATEIYSSDLFVGGKGIVHVGRKKALEFKGKGKIDNLEINLL